MARTWLLTCLLMMLCVVLDVSTESLPPLPSGPDLMKEAD